MTSMGAMPGGGGALMALDTCAVPIIAFGPGGGPSVDAARVDDKFEPGSGQLLALQIVVGGFCMLRASVPCGSA
jgi:hypothetical protein